MVEWNARQALRARRRDPVRRYGLRARRGFAGTPGGVGPFRIRTETDDVVADVSAGVDVIATDGATLKLFYDGRFGDLVEEHSAGAKTSLVF